MVSRTNQLSCSSSWMALNITGITGKELSDLCCLCMQLAFIGAKSMTGMAHTLRKVKASLVASVYEVVSE